jgi:hypothetical protein
MQKQNTPTSPNVIQSAHSSSPRQTYPSYLLLSSYRRSDGPVGDAHSKSGREGEEFSQQVFPLHGPPQQVFGFPSRALDAAASSDEEKLPQQAFPLHGPPQQLFRFHLPVSEEAYAEARSKFSPEYYAKKRAAQIAQKKANPPEASTETPSLQTLDQPSKEPLQTQLEIASRPHTTPKLTSPHPETTQISNRLRGHEIVLSDLKKQSSKPRQNLTQLSKTISHCCERFLTEMNHWFNLPMDNTQAWKSMLIDNPATPAVHQLSFDLRQKIVELAAAGTRLKSKVEKAMGQHTEDNRFSNKPAAKALRAKNGQKVSAMPNRHSIGR